MSAFNGATASSGRTCTVGESKSMLIMEAGEPPFLEGGDHNMGTSLGALDVVGLLSTVGESESTPIVDAGEAPLIPEGGDD